MDETEEPTYTEDETEMYYEFSIINHTAKQLLAISQPFVDGTQNSPRGFTYRDLPLKQLQVMAALAERQLNALERLGMAVRAVAALKEGLGEPPFDEIVDATP